MTKYESQIYTLNTTQAEAYARMADLRRFEVLKQAFADPEPLQQLLQQVPADQVNKDQITPERLEEMRGYLEQMSFTQDSLSADTKMGQITLAIVERDEPKMVKLVTQGSPVSATVWVQLLPQGSSQCAMKVTVGTELNFFMRKMVEKHLKKAPDGIATFLSQVLAHV